MFFFAAFMNANFSCVSISLLIPITVFPTNFTGITMEPAYCTGRSLHLCYEKKDIMDEIVKIDSIAQYNAMRGVPTLHPLITVLDLSKANPMPAQTFNFGVYAVYLKELDCGELKYGRSHYDYQEGTLVFIAPGQIIGVSQQTKTFQPRGWALLFHPDLIKGTSLGKHIQQYSFFSYDVNEALHLSEKLGKKTLKLNLYISNSIT